MRKAKGKDQDKGEQIEILEVSQGRLEVCILGITPLLYNRMSEKARRQLLMPEKKNRAERNASLKHDPIEEYRSSPYTFRHDNAPTRLAFPASAFKIALADVATDMPGATKAQLGRLTSVDIDFIPIWGVPLLHMSVVRSADMNKTPDIRTRAILPQWATRVAIKYVRPILREKTIVNLLAAAGIMRGIGDGRPEKGKLSFGQFQLVGENDPAWLALQKYGRAEQDEAIANPVCYDAETAELLEWNAKRLIERGFANGEEKVETTEENEVRE